MTGKRMLRCAIYTRKSSEEGLDQDFNSLEAQREACESYVRSQAHEGWRVLPELLDDGGYSGGNTERPALKRLLDLVRSGDVDVIVIYKIDRLTRSLTDFARMAETFDKHNVSFVSVTQQFNTTTSMGRLMLNVLLSFAQFEREITGERIRDKIAASKRKGMWMGGNPPIGYDVKERQLLINEADSATVRRIFEMYLEAGTVPALLHRLHADGVLTAKRYSAKGSHHGERPFTRGHLYKLLANPIYVGRVPHKAASHPGQHQPIIEKSVWDAVQKQLEQNVQGPRTRRGRAMATKSLLAGVLITTSGNALIDSHANKGSRRYRYYIENHSEPDRPPIRLPAGDIDAIVVDTVTGFLRDRGALLSRLKDLDRTELQPALERATRTADNISASADRLRHEKCRPLLRKVVYREDALEIELDGSGLRAALGVVHLESGANNFEGSDHDPIVLFAPLIARRRGRQLKLVVAGKETNTRVDTPLVTAVARAHQWAQALVTGEVRSITEVARIEGVSPTYVGQLLPLGFLAPTLVETILAGRQDSTLTANRLIWRETVHISWREQCSLPGDRL